MPARNVTAASSGGAGSVPVSACASHSDCPSGQFCGAADPDEDAHSKPACFECAGGCVDEQMKVVPKLHDRIKGACERFSQQ